MGCGPSRQPAKRTQRTTAHPSPLAVAGYSSAARTRSPSSAVYASSPRSFWRTTMSGCCFGGGAASKGTGGQVRGRAAAVRAVAQRGDARRDRDVLPQPRHKPRRAGPPPPRAPVRGGGGGGRGGCRLWGAELTARVAKPAATPAWRECGGTAGCGCTRVWLIRGVAARRGGGCIWEANGAESCCRPPPRWWMWPMGSV